MGSSWHLMRIRSILHALRATLTEPCAFDAGADAAITRRGADEMRGEG